MLIHSNAQFGIFKLLKLHCVCMNLAMSVQEPQTMANRFSIRQWAASIHSSSSLRSEGKSMGLWSDPTQKASTASAQQEEYANDLSLAQLMAATYNFLSSYARMRVQLPVWAIKLSSQWSNCTNRQSWHPTPFYDYLLIIDLQATCQDKARQNRLESNLDSIQKL